MLSALPCPPLLFIHLHAKSKTKTNLQNNSTYLHSWQGPKAPVGMDDSHNRWT